MSGRIAFATATVVANDLVDDDRILARAFEAHGYAIEALSWDGAPLGELSVDAVILRSVWNYHLERGAFLAWARAVGAAVPLFNPYALVEANSDKSYLLDLQRAGVPIVPTHLVGPGHATALTDVMAASGWDRIVIKPAVSASSYRTMLVGAGGANVEEGQRHLEELARSGAALVQPFVPEVLAMGERSLVFFDGRYSHAIQKQAFNPIDARIAIPIEPAVDVMAVADAALATLGQTPLYARVDVVACDDGSAYLMELELIEPELYFRACASAADRFVEAFTRRMAESSGPSRTLS